MATNGKIELIKVLVGIIVTIIIVITLPTMAKAIWENDIRNSDAHTQIRKEVRFEVDSVRTQVGSVKTIVTDFQLEQTAFNSRLSERLGME